MKKLAILLSTYNGEKYLETQLKSLLAQTIASQTTIIIRDDGSSDNTIEILKKYQEKGNIICHKESNVGVVRSFFTLLRSAPTTEYYAFCDQDDYWMPQKMEKAIEALEKIEEPALYCSRKIIVDKDLKKMSKKDKEPLFNFLDVLMKGNIASGCTMVFNNPLRDLFLKFIPDDVEIKHLYHDTWLFILAYFTGKIVYSKKSYILYRQHGNNVVGAMRTGNQLLFHRLTTIDFTLKKYRKRNKATFYTCILYKNYYDDLLPKYREKIYDVFNSRTSMSSRLRLFFSGGLTKQPLYEYLIYKMYILLGWL